MSSINIIAAMDENRGIGNNNQLLFKIPDDFVRMKTLTMGHPIIMGRKTFESVGRVLPGRVNIIITRDKGFKVEGAHVAHSLNSAIHTAKKSKGAEAIFIFGGGEIFKQALPLVDKLYLTIVKGHFAADTFFPDYSSFSKELKREMRKWNIYSYTFLDLER